jgi:hypothetical protein
VKAYSCSTNRKQTSNSQASSVLPKNSIQPTIILNFDFWMKELKELSSLLQFACSTSTREPLYTTYTKHKNQKKLWHKFCYNPSTPSILSIIQRQKSLSPSGMALPCNKSSIGNACRKFLQVGYGPIRQFCAPKAMQFRRTISLSLSEIQSLVRFLVFFTWLSSTTI